MLTGKQMLFLSALLENSSTTKAIIASGVKKSTAYRWMQQEEFRMELQKRKTEMLSGISMFLQNSLSTCCERLMDIVNDSDVSAQIKINAISLIFQNARAFTEQADILERMQIIEEMLQDRKDTWE